MRHQAGAPPPRGRGTRMEHRSDRMKKGAIRAPHRSLLKADGLIDEEIARPLVAVINSANDIIPGHVGMDRVAEAVKTGVRIAGGTPLEISTIGVCDGIAMGHEGMKLLARQPRGHRGLGGDRRLGARLRCGGAHPQLRQDHPRHAHGRRAARPADRRGLRRADARGALGGQARRPRHGLHRGGRRTRWAR